MQPRPRRIAPLSGSLAILLSLSQAAQAHTTWANGQPVPEWVTTACCGPTDAHHLRVDQVRRVPDGFRIDGYQGTVYDAQVLPSEDGEYWAFYSETTQNNGDKIFTSIFCFFAPSWS